MANNFLDNLSNRVLIFDGAMGTNLHALQLDPDNDYLGRENCHEVLNLTRPDIVQSLHEQFFEVGCDIVETNTLGGMPHALADNDLADRCHEINLNAVKAARAACDNYTTSDKPRYIAGSIGPGSKLITLGNITWADLLASYKQQARGLLQGGPGVGADLILIETVQDILQAKCAVIAVIDVQKEMGLWNNADKVPVFVQVTIETSGTMLLGTEIGAALASLAQLPIDGIGMNCATGPTEMTENIKYLTQNSTCFVSVQPNAGMPQMVDGEIFFPLTPDELAQALKRFVNEDGVNIVGGCCGTTPAHLKQVVDAIGVRAPVKRDVVSPAQCSSLYFAVDLKQETSILMVGERTNANGSRKFKTMLLENDWDGMVSWGRTELKGGAHVLDLCIDFVGRDGVDDIRHVVSRFSQQLHVPLMLDSTDKDVIEAGLQLTPGKCIVNSINLEEGEKRLDDICPLLKRYGAAVVALTIDEDQQAGMAKTADRKLAIAKRLHKLCTDKWQLDERDILFDPLTFTICTGNDDDRKLGLETLNGIELISRHFPNSGIILGLSNISFGLKPASRQILNSVYLYEAIQRGLTAAIVHASKILPKHKISDEHWQAAQWLIYDRRGDDRPEGKPNDFDPLINFIELFDDDAAISTSQPAQENVSIEQCLINHIVDGEKLDLETDLDEALKKHDALTIINDYLLGGMKKVGELFGSGQMQLPFVLQSAEVMKMAVAHLESHIDRKSNHMRGRIVLATVKGDVHDIGKNLVDIILSNNGYEVINLGIKQPLNNIIQAAKKYNANAIGMSGLLVKSVATMHEYLTEMRQQGIITPVLLGGAALTRKYTETELANAYNGPVHYARDAFEGLRIMADLTADATIQHTDNQHPDNQHTAIQNTAIQNTTTSNSTTDHSIDRQNENTSTAVLHSSTVATDIPIPTPPFWGSRIVTDIPLDDIYSFINRNALYRGQWSFKKGKMSDAEYQDQIENEIEPLFERLCELCRSENILQPCVAYGYYPCNADGNNIVIYDPANSNHNVELERFTFPRQSDKKHLCIADYFRPADSGERDVIAMTCVTIGPKVSQRIKALFDNNVYTQYLYMHGLAVQSAEALAELWHKHIRHELGIDTEDDTDADRVIKGHYRGCRYSFGYAACPDLALQTKLFRLLQPDRIGCSLTENYQITPEQSTSAIIAHHPEARYFSI